MKYIKMSTFIYVCELLCLTLCLPMSHTVSGDKQPICCAPEQWEGTMLLLLYLDYGTVFLYSNTAFSYINGTVRIAYSVFNKKIYLGKKCVEHHFLFRFYLAIFMDDPSFRLFEVPIVRLRF